MDNYYIDKLNSSNLFRVYETNIDRISQFLNAEIEFIRDKLTGNERIIELGAGYGRIMKELAGNCLSITGIDISEQSVNLAKEYLRNHSNCEVLILDVFSIDMESQFDVALCLQNGLSAIKGGDTENIVSEAMKTLKPGGVAYFSSYSPKFWQYRLEWFKEQAEKGLIGEIDIEKSKDGYIICKDGFTARTISEDEFKRLGSFTGCEYNVHEHDDSIVFLTIQKPL